MGGRSSIYCERESSIKTKSGNWQIIAKHKIAEVRVKSSECTKSADQPLERKAASASGENSVHLHRNTQLATETAGESALPLVPAQRIAAPKLPHIQFKPDGDIVPGQISEPPNIPTFQTAC